MFYVIYKITNTVNDKFYIGITSEGLDHRFKGHCKRAKFGSTTNFHKALRKYGSDAFTKKILHSFEESDKKKAYLIEQKHINETQAVKLGYNMDMFPWGCGDKSGKNNPMYGKISGNAKKVVVFGIEYTSATLAAQTLKNSPKTISQWARSTKKKDAHCYYI